MSISIESISKNVSNKNSLVYSSTISPSYSFLNSRKDFIDAFI